MAYKEVLLKIIKDSELSLREISSRCETIGLSISPSYISQLQTGKLPPPSEEVSKVIAQVCKINDATELIFEGYMEKAPELIKYYLTATSQVNKQLLKILMPLAHPNIDEEYVNMLDKFTTLNYTVSYLEKLKRETKIESFVSMYGVLKKKLTINKTIDEMEQVFIEDTSMEPFIAQNSKLNCIFYDDDEPQERDIIAFRAEDNKRITARRYYRHNDIITLVPENKEFDIIYINDLYEISLYGKVISFTTSINY